MEFVKDQHKFSNQFIKNVCSGPLKILVNTIIVFFSYRYFLQVFGVDKYSIWLLLGVIIDFSRLGNLGISDIIIKYVAEARGQQDKVRLCQYVSTSLLLIVAFVLLLGTPLLLAKSFAPQFIHIAPDYIPLFTIMYDKILILSFLLILLELFLGILFGLGRADVANYLQSASTFFGTLLSILLVYFKFDFMGLYLGTLTGTVGVMMISLYYIYKILGYFPFKLAYFNKVVVQDILHNSMIMFTSSIINLFFLPAGKILISRYIGSTEVVCYDLAFKLGFQIRGLFDLGLKALVPEFSGLKANTPELFMVLRKIYKYLFAAVIPVFSVIFIFSSTILQLWLSSAYLPLINDSFRIIFLGFTINLFAVPMYYLLLAHGKFLKILWGYMIQSCVVFACSLLYFLYLGGQSYYVFLFINLLGMTLASAYLLLFNGFTIRWQR